MTTLVDALVAILIANWGGGGGGGVVPATIVAITDYRILTPARDSVDNIYLELGTVQRRQVNNNYCDVTSTILVTVTSATSDDRLKIIVDECRWICNNVAVTGVNSQKVTNERDQTDRARKVWVYQLTVECIENLVGSSSAYGTPGTEVNMAAALMIGVANAAWVPTVPLSENDDSGAYHGSWKFENHSGAITVWFMLPMPCNRGGLKLYVAQLRMYNVDADANDYIDNIRVYGVKASDGSVTSAGEDPTDWNAIGAVAWDPADIDMSAYSQCLVRIVTVFTTAGDLEFTWPELKVYYNT